MDLVILIVNLNWSFSPSSALLTATISPVPIKAPVLARFLSPFFELPPPEPPLLELPLDVASAAFDTEFAVPPLPLLELDWVAPPVSVVFPGPPADPVPPPLVLPLPPVPVDPVDPVLPTGGWVDEPPPWVELPEPEPLPPEPEAGFPLPWPEPEPDPVFPLPVFPLEPVVFPPLLLDEPFPWLFVDPTDPDEFDEPPPWVELPDWLPPLELEEPLELLLLPLLLFPFPPLFFFSSLLLELPPLPDPSPLEPLLTVFPRFPPTILEAPATLDARLDAIIETDVILVRVEIILFVTIRLVEVTAWVVAWSQGFPAFAPEVWFNHDIKLPLLKSALLKVPTWP